MPEVACGLVIDDSMSLARTDARQEIARRWNKSGNFFEVVTEEVGSTQGKCMRSLAASNFSAYLIVSVPFPKKLR